MFDEVGIIAAIEVTMTSTPIANYPITQLPNYTNSIVKEIGVLLILKMDEVALTQTLKCFNFWRSQL